MTRLPMTVISGYLGAGKTTLINNLIVADHGLKLMILVNDFGAINIDAELLASQDEDTIALTNGCVCCTLGSDLFLALGDALDRYPRPDYLIVEASGVADPSRIANAARAEPDMRYAGIVTLVDGQTFDGLACDPLIGAQFRNQIARADLVVVTKQVPNDLEARLVEITNAPVLRNPDSVVVSDLVVSELKSTKSLVCTDKHSDYTAWVSEKVSGVNKDVLLHALSRRPTGLFRVKGTVIDSLGVAWGVQVVGQNIEINSTIASNRPAIVGIGLSARVNTAEIDVWWDSISA